MKLPKADVNLCKIVTGVAFSLLWAWIMYLLWPEPSFLTFLWFYLVLGSIILKWAIFWIIDRIHLRMRLKALNRELDASDRRIHDIERNLEGDEDTAGSEM